MGTFFAAYSNRHPSITGILRFLEFDHLTNAQLRGVSFMFANIAVQLCDTLPDDPELAVALRKIREAKDCAVGLAAHLYSIPPTVSAHDSVS